MDLGAMAMKGYSKTGVSPLNGFISYPGHLLGGCYTSAEMQSVYSTVPTGWAQDSYEEKLKDKYTIVYSEIYFSYWPLWFWTMASTFSTKTCDRLLKKINKNFQKIRGDVGKQLRQGRQQIGTVTYMVSMSNISFWFIYIEGRERGGIYCVKIL